MYFTYNIENNWHNPSCADWIDSFGSGSHSFSANTDIMARVHERKRYSLEM